MPEGELSAARARIDTVDRRLTALQDLGIDTAGLRSQLSLARARIDEGGPGDAHAVLDEIAEAARRLAAGATARSSEWRGLPRERVVEELRRIVAEGGAGEAVSALREHIDERLRDFERRVRDQFARELAQVIASRPWAREPVGDPGLAAEVAQLRAAVASASAARPTVLDREAVRAEVEALVRPVADEVHAELDRLRGLAAGGSAEPGWSTMREELERLRREVGALHPDQVIDPARIRGLVDEALATRAVAPSPSDDILRGLVVQAGAIQDRLSERLLGLERQLGGLVDRLASGLPRSAPGGPAVIVPGSVPATTALPLPLPTPSDAGAPESARIPAAIHLPEPSDPPSGSDWIFPGDDSRAPAAVGGVTAVAPQPVPPLVAIEQKTREASSPGADASEAKTAAIGIQQEAVTAPVVHDDRPPALGADEALVKRLIEARLASWRPSPGDDLVSDEAEQARQLVRLLPAALQDPAVRTGLFAALALEATAHPGVLAELTGLRGFLRRELRLAVDEIKKEIGAVGV